jgi:N-methylhydantoinase B
VERRTDSITFEILSHRLWQIALEGRAALFHISGSPVAYAAGDMAVGILKSDAEAVVVGGGNLNQSGSLRQAAKSLLKRFKNPELALPINEDDVFFLNDPYMVGSHAPDVCLIEPVFWEGKQVAWTGAVSHHTDTGGVDPGSHGTRATNVFEEGIRFPVVKIIDRGELRSDVLTAFTANTRDPEIVTLDIKGKIGACHVMKERISDVIEAFGVDTILTFFDEYIDYTVEMSRARLKEIPDGTWRIVYYLDAGGRGPNIYRLHLKLTKKGDRLTADFSESCDQIPNLNINSTAAGSENNIMTPVFPILFHKSPWTEGIYKVVDLVLREGSICDCKYPAAVSTSMPCGIQFASWAMMTVTMSNMLYTSEKYRNEACAVMGGGFLAPHLVGMSKEGNYYICFLMDALAAGMGALPDKDGCNTSGNITGPYNVIPNVETIEAMYPVLYLNRKEVVDSAGAGKFRGGTALEFQVILWDAAGEADVLMVGVGAEFRNSLGISGGYPAANSQIAVLRNSNVREVLKSRVLSFNELEGEEERHGTRDIFKIKDVDVLRISCSGGGGWGDPIERDPELVCEDVVTGYTSIEMAEEAYGVILDPKKLEVNIDKTKECREKIRVERLKKGRIK